MRDSYSFRFLLCRSLRFGFFRFEVGRYGFYCRFAVFLLVFGCAFVFLYLRICNRLAFVFLYLRTCNRLAFVFLYLRTCNRLAFKRLFICDYIGRLACDSRLLGFYFFSLRSGFLYFLLAFYRFFLVTLWLGRLFSFRVISFLRFRRSYLLTIPSRIVACEDNSSADAAHSSLVAEFVCTTEEI